MRYVPALALALALALVACGEDKAQAPVPAENVTVINVPVDENTQEPARPVPVKCHKSPDLCPDLP